MGESEPSLSDHFHVWLKKHVPDRILRGPGPILPTSNTTDDPNGSTLNVLPGAGATPVPPSAAGGTDEKSPAHDGPARLASAGSLSDTSSPGPASPPKESPQDHGPPAAINGGGDGSAAAKLGWPARARAGSRRFVKHTKNAVFNGWINVLLIFVPIGIAVNYAPIQGSAKPTIVFALNAVAVIPLAGLLSHATEGVASSMGDTWASLLNVTFGNAVELIIFILALVKNQLSIVQASILGSILANLLLILGMAFLLGGMRYREQIYNNTVTQMSTVLLALAVSSLLLPTAFHATFSNNNDADLQTTKISRGTCVVLLIVYILYLLFQLKSHAYMYESTPQHVLDEEAHPGFLADIMTASSTDSSSSSSDSDSDSSSGSHRTTRQRIKRAFRHRIRRKSNASSFVAASSALSSPSTVMEEPLYFEDDEDVATGGAPSGHAARSTRSPSYVDSQSDPSGQHARGMPRVRDFEAEQPDTPSAVNSTSRKYRKQQRKLRKMTRKASAANDLEKGLGGVASTTPTASNAPALDGGPAMSTASTSQRVDFAINPAPVEVVGVVGAGPTAATAEAVAPSIQQHQSSATTATLRRPFIAPRLPSVFKDTVFTTPAPVPTATPAQVITSPGALSLVRGTRLRRTRSTPDDLHARPQPISTSALPAAASHAPVAVGGAPMTETGMGSGAGGVGAMHDGIVEGEEPLSRTASVTMLLITTGLVAFCAELLVDAIPEMIENTNVSQAFIGLIVLPIVGNAAEHVTAVSMAIKNKMDLAIGVSVGSSIQIALFITPVVVLLGWILDKELSLYFNLFETVSLFVTIFVVNFLVLDGRSNYLEGSLLIAMYVIIAVAAFFYPSQADASLVGGGDGPSASMLSARMF